MSFAFVHAADLHLDSPLKGLAIKDPAMAAAFQRASRTALNNLVATAIDLKVDFVVLAGDIFDGDWKNYETGLVFERAMSRLERARIPVYAIRGNHDADSVITKRLTAGSVRFCLSQVAESIALEHLDVVIHGHSFSRRVCTDNLAANYPLPIAGKFNLGLLHTSLAGAEGHEAYAPCELRELAAKGYGYWALGHIHKPARMAIDPWVVYPGNLQGRHARELGPRGAVLVEVRDQHVAEVRDLVLDAARWTHLEVDVSGAVEFDQVIAVFRQCMEPAVDRAEGRPLAVRTTLRGDTALHGFIGHARDRLRAELALAAHHVADTVMLEKVIVASTPLGDGAGAGLPDGFAAMLREAAEDPALAATLAADLQDLRAKLSSDLFQDPANQPFDPAAADQLLRDSVSVALAAAGAGEA